ncbi:alpha/beta fold hydrolase [Leucobacter chironomi]|uniref:alpha/beta fold hydrolase n=1 Tax=Leucobacter chironomi TaxID=491918 RepID=UPI0009FC68DC|nr:alpha/beta fold hydrolase [Leucobacter chironomi]
MSALRPRGAAPEPPPLPTPERTDFRADTHELHVFRWRRPGAPRVLLVHGIGMGHSVYDRFLAEIRTTCEAIAIDLPGFADCPEPADPLSMPATADLVAAALREQHAAPLIAVGHSMGAQIVAELAARHPELVKRVVLIAPSVNPAERSLPKQAFRMVQDLAEGEPFSVVTRATKTYLQAGPIWFMRKLRQMLAHRVERCLPRISQPALVLRGTQDRVCPRGWAVRITGLLPRGEMRQIPDRGHEALISSGQPVAQLVLDWIGADSADSARQMAGDATDLAFPTQTL